MTIEDTPLAIGQTWTKFSKRTTKRVAVTIIALEHNKVIAEIEGHRRDFTLPEFIRALSVNSYRLCTDLEKALI
jgi:hypothetical protein